MKAFPQLNQKLF